MRLLSLLFIIIVFCTAGVAQPGLTIDTGMVVQTRSFNQATVASLQKQKQFRYDENSEPAISLWDRFWGWFWYQVESLFNAPGGKTTFWTIGILFAVAAIGFFIFKASGMNRDGLFGRTAKGNIPYEISSEDIHTIPFAQAIEDAVRTGNYRLATRLLYLQLLKFMADEQMIAWQINKTNTDYVKEVAAQPWSPLFQNLTTRFEYAWYGDAPVTQANFGELENQFQQFYNRPR